MATRSARGRESPTTLVVPACFSVRRSIGGNPFRQMLIVPGVAEVVSRRSELVARMSDDLSYRIVRTRTSTAEGPVLSVPESINIVSGTRIDGTGVKWLSRVGSQDPAEVLRSLEGAFSFLEEDAERGVKGLRVPQAGAVHAVLGYWSTAPVVPATVVMPTGTGKTEVMLALLAAARPQLLLVLVPSDALRDQIAAKFEAFGVLQEYGVVAWRAHRPVVGRIRHGIKTEADAGALAGACNVIVGTPQALNASSLEARLALLSSCSHLFIDEAHHVPAETWRQLRDEFSKKPIVQLTATPFREDGRQLGGRQIYAFPLGEAQRQGYFSRIRYISVVDFENQDRAVAERALQHLREDLDAGFDHLLMARLRRIGRAEDILAIYQELAPGTAPVILHSSISAARRREALEAIRQRDSRVIICVDMLGEGFDLPALKVAAIHDAHKSLGVTLQFVGRFARVAGSDIGEASVVVGRPDLRYDDRLRRLYGEDSDWNKIIQDLSESAVEQQQETSDFEAAFGSVPDEVPLRTLLPKMSTVIYRTRTKDWQPQTVYELYPEDELLTMPIAINESDHVAWFVTKIRSPVTWGELETVEEIAYELFVLYWDPQRQLLYINSSNNSSLHEGLAKAVCGTETRRITGENVYRVMAQVNRLVPTNVGVLDIRNRARRFSMHVGADVTEGFPVAEAQTKTKTNIFAYGYEDGLRVSVGASLKGRIWSYRVADTLKEWVDWCNHVGRKLIDETISVDEVLRNFIRPQVVEERPVLVPLAIEWPWEVFRSTTEEVRVSQDGSEWPLVDTDLRISRLTTTGPIAFNVTTQEWSAEYEAILGDGEMKFRSLGPEISVVSRWAKMPLSEYLGKYGVLIYLEQDTVVVPPGMLLRPDRTLPPFDLDKLRVVDWTGVNIRKESQGPMRDQDAIQAQAIQDALTLADWDLVLDDDGPGEMADVVAIRTEEDRLIVRLVHCKFSSEDKPGARVADLYELCGQAQKSAQWRRNVPLFLQHLIRRERRRKERQGRTGIEKGSATELYRVEEQSRLLRPDFTICIAQPGLSKGAVSNPQLELLASTETYVYETVYAAFEVLCSA